MSDDDSVVVYGKKGCPHCEELKAWLEKYSVRYRFQSLVDFGPDWRTDGSREAMATSARYNDSLPIALFRNKFMPMLEAQKRIAKALGLKEFVRK